MAEFEKTFERQAVDRLVGDRVDRLTRQLSDINARLALVADWEKEHGAAMTAVEFAQTVSPALAAEPQAFPWDQLLYQIRDEGK